MDDVLRKAVHTHPGSHNQEQSEFMHDLRYSDPNFLSKAR
jgi:hypothetical protein